MRTFLTFTISFFICVLCQGQIKIIKTQNKAIKDVSEVLIPISNSPDSLNDLEFLKNVLSDKRIVYLGESNHHSETYNKIKLRLIKFLHSEMGFNVIAFESNISSCIHSNLVKDSLGPLYLLTHTINGCWRTESNYELMSYIKDEDINITGFDPNLNSLILDKKYYQTFFPNNSGLSTNLFVLDSTFQAYDIDRSKYLHSKKENLFTENELNEIRDSLTHQYSDFLDNSNSSKQFQLLKITIKNKLKILGASNHFLDNIESQYVTDENREQMMGQNLEFILDSIFPNQKVIIWAHNGHISKGGKSTDYKIKNSFLNNSIGYRLNQKYGSQSYVIGLYGYPGIIGKGYPTETESLVRPMKKSLENIMFNCNISSCFVTTDIACFKKPLYNFTEGNFTPLSIISDCYDAIIYFRNLEPAVLIRFKDRDKYK